MKKPEPLADGLSGELELSEPDIGVSIFGTNSAESCCAAAICSGVINAASASRASYALSAVEISRAFKLSSSTFPICSFVGGLTVEVEAILNHL